MKRILSVFLCAVALMCAMVVPAFAAESFFVECREDGIQSFVIPEGYYMVYGSIDTEDGFSMRGSTKEPIKIRYWSETGSDGIERDVCSVSIDLYHSSGDYLTVPFFLIRGVESTQVFIVEDSEAVPLEPVSGQLLSFRFDPVESSSPSLTGIVDSGVMSGVLDQVVSILPVVLVVIMSFIGIRKGISFLRGILSGA